MSIPTAVSPSQLTPGVYLTVDLLAGAASPGTDPLRIALIAPKASSGDLTVDTEVRAGGGPDTAATAFGTGSPGHLAAKKLYGRFPAAQVDFVAPTAGAGTATLDVTLSGAPSVSNAVLCDIMGREFEVAWLVGETADEVKDKVIAAINQRSDDLACVASSGGTGIVQIDGKVTGNISNDIKVQVTLKNTQSGTEAIAGAVTPTALAGGTTDPDLTTALSNLQGKEYAYMLPCLSNADVANVGALSNMGRIVDHIQSLNEGLDAKLQQAIFGYTGTIALATAASVNANGAQNETFAELILCINGRGLPCELGALETGGRVAAESFDPSANRIGEDMSEFIGAKDKIADKPSLSESEAALGGGVSLISYTAQDLEVLVRAVTTRSQTDVGGPDRRLLDVQNVSGTYAVARDLRSAIPQEFPKAKITPDIEPGEDPPPEGVVEERDVKAFIQTRLRFWQTRGVVTKQSIDNALANETLIVRVNPSDATQVDIVVPVSITQPWAKTGLVVQRVPN